MSGKCSNITSKPDGDSTLDRKFRLSRRGSRRVTSECSDACVVFASEPARVAPNGSPGGQDDWKNRAWQPGPRLMHRDEVRASRARLAAGPLRDRTGPVC